MSPKLKSWLAAALVAGTALVSVPACVVEDTGPQPVYETETEPPPPQEESVAEQRPGFVYVRGHWDWIGGRWAWRAGHWQAIREGSRWRDGYWERRGNHYHWVEGHWEHSGDTVLPPPPVPSQPPVIIHDHTTPN